MNSNQKGFTLIELLAVIVVLAIVMLVAVNAVLPQMEKARRNSFSIEVNGLIKSAQQHYVIAQMGNFVLDKGQTCCVDLTYLISTGQSELKESDGYKGFVLINNDATGNIIYKPYLENGTFYTDASTTSENKSYGEADAKSVSGKSVSYNSCDSWWNSSHTEPAQQNKEPKCGY